MKFDTIEELLSYTEAIKGKTFKEIDTKHLLDNTTNLKRNKGILGHVVESGFYKYPINSNPQADFDKIGVELKVTGYKKNMKGEKSAKERVSLSKIDFNKIVNEEYEYSKLIYKNRKILFIWYFYEKGKDIGDFLITDYQLYDMGQDEETFKNDFYIIKQKVKDGRAHELSEGDTSYLGACTKARTSKDRTTQPYSDIPAKPRAYSLKNSYMSGILNSIGTTITFDTNEFKTVEEYVLSKLRPYIGKTQLEILEEVSGRTYSERIPKNINKMITDLIIGKDDELEEKHDLFKKTSHIIKNSPITPKGTYRERMSFRNLTLSEFEETWEDSWDSWSGSLSIDEDGNVQEYCSNHGQESSHEGRLERIGVSTEGLIYASSKENEPGYDSPVYGFQRSDLNSIFLTYLSGPDVFGLADYEGFFLTRDSEEPGGSVRDQAFFDALYDMDDSSFRDALAQNDQRSVDFSEPEEVIDGQTCRIVTVGEMRKDRWTVIEWYAVSTDSLQRIYHYDMDSDRWILISDGAYGMGGEAWKQNI